MTSAERILRRLPKKFTRQDVLKLMLGKGYSVSYANNIIEQLTHQNKAQRIKAGHYRKTEN